MSRLCLPCAAALAGVFALPALASAQRVTTFAPKRGTLANLAPVVAPAARCVALGETQGLLAFGHDRPHADAHVSLFRLDARGKPGPSAISWKLPCSEAVAKTGTYPVNLAFHPKLPLLYVWQDVALHLTNPPPPLPPQLKDFDHLLIYDVSKARPELVAALCRGADYMHGQQGGGLAVDPAGEFLYVPSVHDPKNRSYLKFGRFPLDADGLPDVLGEKDGKLPRDQRIKKLAERAAAGLVPPQLSPFDYGFTISWSNHGSAASFQPLSKEAILVGGGRGVMVWRPYDKDCALSALPLKKADHTLLTVHPSLPLLFATVAGSDSLFRVQHADGYPTLLPQQWTLPDVVLLSPPAVLTKSKKLAVGGRHFVYVFSLDEKGCALPEVVQVQVFNPLVRALVYSERFDRLYVSVELSR
jgi:hypothetical protein